MERDPDPAKGRVLPRGTGNCDQEEDNLLGRRRKGAGPGRRASSPSSRGPGRTPVGLGEREKVQGRRGGGLYLRRRWLPLLLLLGRNRNRGCGRTPCPAPKRVPLARRVRCPSAFPGAARRRSSEFRARTFPLVAPRAAPERPE